MDQSVAFKTGQIIGIILFCGVFLSVLVFSFIAIIKAFTKRTAGWIVGGILGGLFLGSFLLLFAAGVAKGYQAAISRRAAMAEKPASATHPPQTVTGHKLPYTIVLTDGWQKREATGGFDLMVSKGDIYLGIIAEEIALNAPENAASLARQRIHSIDAEASISENEPLVLDGHDWVQFTAKATAQQIPFAYEFYMYTGKEGTFQLMGWTGQNIMPRYREQLLKIMQSFRFPPQSPASTEANQPATPAAPTPQSVDPFHVGTIAF